MGDNIPLSVRFLRRLARMVPSPLAYRVALLFWEYAYNYISDEEADAFMHVLTVGNKHWKGGA